MKQSISKTNFLYYRIMYTLWRLADYFSDLLGYDAPENPLEMDMSLCYSGDIPFFIIRLDEAYAFIRDDDAPTYPEAVDILNEYLYYSLLPESGIRPYCSGSGEDYDIVPRLYVDDVAPGILDGTPHYMAWRILVIDSPEAYSYYVKRNSIKQNSIYQ